MMDCYYDDFTILNLLEDLEKSFKVDSEIKELASESDITRWNNKPFRTLYNDWLVGEYDNDKETLYRKIIELL
jgi:hypothetical protein